MTISKQTQKILNSFGKSQPALKLPGNNSVSIPLGDIVKTACTTGYAKGIIDIPALNAQVGPIYVISKDFLPRGSVVTNIVMEVITKISSTPPDSATGQIVIVDSTLSHQPDAITVLSLDSGVLSNSVDQSYCAEVKPIRIGIDTTQWTGHSTIGIQFATATSMTAGRLIFHVYYISPEQVSTPNEGEV